MNEFPEDVVGFVYLITELDTDRKYIGKKFAWKKVLRKVGNRKKKVDVPSDWQKYYGSSKELLANVAIKGPQNYKREILYLGKTKGELAYLEAKEQFDRNVLLDSSYFNGFIGCKINQQSLKHLKEDHEKTTIHSSPPA